MAGEKNPITVIRSAVTLRRKIQGIRPEQLSHKSKPEGSCNAQGEGPNLLTQLTNTEEPYGDWEQLNIPDVLELAVQTAEEYLDSHSK